MGYKVSGLNRLPIVPGVDLYVFLLGKRIWDGSLRGIIERNFSTLAEELGPSAAIVAGHGGSDLTKDIVEAAGENSKVRSLVEAGERGGGGILIMGAHPLELSDDDLVLYAPLNDLAGRFGTLDGFLDGLCRFADDRDPEFLSKFECKDSISDLAAQVVDLRPNLFGIGININRMINLIRENREK